MLTYRVTYFSDGTRRIEFPNLGRPGGPHLTLQIPELPAIHNRRSTSSSDSPPGRGQQAANCEVMTMAARSPCEISHTQAPVARGLFK